MRPLSFPSLSVYLCTDFFLSYFVTCSCHCFCQCTDLSLLFPLVNVSVCKDYILGCSLIISNIFMTITLMYCCKTDSLRLQLWRSESGAQFGCWSFKYLEEFALLSVYICIKVHFRWRLLHSVVLDSGMAGNIHEQDTRVASLLLRRSGEIGECEKTV